MFHKQKLDGVVLGTSLQFKSAGYELSHCRVHVSWWCQAHGSWPADERPWSLISEAPDNYRGWCLSHEYLAKSSTDPSSVSLKNFNLEVENFFLFSPGESANIILCYHKLCSWVSHIWGSCQGQHTQSVMAKPCHAKTIFMTMVSPLPREE